MKKTLVLTILAGALLFAAPTLYAQSLQQLVEALPQALHPFGGKAAVERIFKLPVGVASNESGVSIENPAEQDTTYSEVEQPTQLFDDCDFSVIERNKSRLHIAWEDGSELIFQQLSARGGHILAVIRSVKEPFAISSLQLYDKTGNDVSGNFTRPRPDGSNFVPSKATPRESELLSMLPVSLTFSGVDKPILIMALSSEKVLPLEERDVIKALLSPAPLKFKWHRKGFTPAK